MFKRKFCYVPWWWKQMKIVLFYLITCSNKSYVSTVCCLHYYTILQATNILPTLLSEYNICIRKPKKTNSKMDASKKWRSEFFYIHTKQWGDKNLSSTFHGVMFSITYLQIPIVAGYSISVDNYMFFQVGLWSSQWMPFTINFA